jgi:tetratricopeptide (TPR) repeat protein
MIALWRTWPKETSTHSSIVALAAAWLLIPLLPALDLRVLVDRDPLHDRYAYLSVFGAALLLAATWQAFHDRWAAAKIARPLFIAAAVAMAFASAIQSQYWANDSALFARSVAIAPSNPWAHWNYGTALNDRGKYAEAEAEFARAYELVPDDRMAAYAGSAAERIERWPDAEQWFRRSIELNQKNAETWFDLGHVLLAEHRAAEAIPALERAIQLGPAAAGYHYDLAAALEQTGRTAEAREQYRAELSIHPEQTGAQQALERLAPALLKSH